VHFRGPPPPNSMLTFRLYLGFNILYRQNVTCSRNVGKQHWMGRGREIQYNFKTKVYSKVANLFSRATNFWPRLLVFVWQVLFALYKQLWQSSKFVRLYGSTKKIWQSNLSTCLRLFTDLLRVISNNRDLTILRQQRDGNGYQYNRSLKRIE
jgi:hypothetical protein